MNDLSRSSRAPTRLAELAQPGQTELTLPRRVPTGEPRPRLVHGRDAKGLTVATYDSNNSYFIREALSEIDVQLKAIPSLDKTTVKFCDGNPAPEVAELPTGTGPPRRSVHRPSPVSSPARRGVTIRPGSRNSKCADRSDAGTRLRRATSHCSACLMRPSLVRLRPSARTRV